jgi:hypothetical protein
MTQGAAATASAQDDVSTPLVKKDTNSEAAMLRIHASCSGVSIGISLGSAVPSPFGLAQDTLSRGSHARE